MPPSCLDTIVAVATPPGRGGISIIRLSGSKARTLSERLLRFRHSGEWQPRRVRSAALVDEQDNPLDEVLATFFAGPHSYTGEDVVEISCHGSPVVVQQGVALALQAGARLAEPGEFTLRAYVSGRIDLPRAEAVRDLIEANTLFQARTAAQQLAGSLSRRVQPIKEKLLELIALLEAGIDFAEDDVDVAQDEEIQARLQTVEIDLQALSASFAYGRLVHEGLRLAIVGRPNVGKSSLFNQLMGEERAIVADQPGTTRDTISETLAINGIPVRLVDTAGIRDAQDHIEALGVQRSYQAMADADVSLLVLDASTPLTPEDEALLEQVQQQGRYLIAASKADLPVQAELPAQAFTVSAKTGQGIDELRHAITESASPPSGLDAQQGFLTNLRQRQLVDDSLQALAQARNSAAIRIPHEMLLRDCYDALRPIDMLTGATTADDILHRIFSTFCIGK